MKTKRKLPSRKSGFKTDHLQFIRDLAREFGFECMEVPPKARAVRRRKGKDL